MFNVTKHASAVAAGAVMLVLSAGLSAAQDINAFFGKFTGQSEVAVGEGASLPRDLTVEISPNREGFNVAWTTVIYRASGKVKETSYSIDFLDTDRDGVFAAAQRKNIFGHAVQLDPMQGDPYVWAQLHDGTLRVFSLFVADDGGYEMQQYDRTLTDAGMRLEFSRVRNGVPMRNVSADLIRQ